MVETGRVINKRYLLQRLIQRGPCAMVYQGADQVLQRPVAVKVVPALYIPAYRAAIRQTAQFSHPNIVGLYDLIVEAETLYVVQEYIEGDDFTTLLQAQQQPHQVAELGTQICLALLYAGSSSRQMSHGDLTPTAIMRDPRGLVRVNNFALPSNLSYFSAWANVGDMSGVSGIRGDESVLADSDVPWGKLTEGRRADDTRAVGILLYQLLTAHAPGTTTVEPPADGRLRFSRNVPPELCEIIARAVIRQHPQHINTPETLLAELKTVAETLEPPAPISVGGPPTPEVVARPQQFQPAGTGKLVTALPTRETDGVLSSRAETGTYMQAMEAPSAPTVADISLKLATARQAAYPEKPLTTPQRRLSFPMLLILGLLAFAIFFAIGYFIATGIHP